MQRLRPLSEAECYARCYGGRDESVTLLGVEPRSLHVAERGRDEAGFEPAEASDTDWSGWAALVPFPQRQA